MSATGGAAAAGAAAAGAAAAGAAVSANNGTLRVDSLRRVATNTDDARAKTLFEISKLLDELQKSIGRMRGTEANVAPTQIDTPNSELERLSQTIQLISEQTTEYRAIIRRIESFMDGQVSSVTSIVSQTLGNINRIVGDYDLNTRSILEANESAASLQQMLVSTNASRAVDKANIAGLKQRIADLQLPTTAIDALNREITNLKTEIESERSSLLPVVNKIDTHIETLIAAVTALTNQLANPPQNVQQTEDLTKALADINQLVARIPAAIAAIPAPIVTVQPPQVNVTPPNVDVSLTGVTDAIKDLIGVVQGAGGIANGAGQTQAPPLPTPSDFELKRDTAVAALQQVIAKYHSYVRNAGDAVPYLKRPYRAEVYYDSTAPYDAADPSKRRFKTRGVLALVPCREFSNLLATGCGALGVAIAALAHARAARARAHVQHPNAALGVLRMNTVVVGLPAGPASRGVVPLDAAGHLATALHGDIAAAEYAIQQAYHELEGRLEPYEVFRAFPPGDARRDAPEPPKTDTEALFRHAASLELTGALDRILARVHVRSESCWPQAGIHPFDTLEALSKHVYSLIAPRTQPSAAMLDRERLATAALARQVAAHEARKHEARVYRESLARNTR
jgi:archaellum component FlaC